MAENPNTRKTRKPSVSTGVGASSNVAKLRAEAKRKQANAAAKVRRLSAKGVDIRATVHDPRADAAKLAKFTTRQLQAHIKKLDAFTDRSHSFVQGASGVPLTKEKFDRYKQLERRINGIVDKRMKDYGGVVIPGSNLTIQERDNTFVGKHAQGDARNKPFTKYDRQPFHIANDKALDKLSAAMEKQLTRKYLPSKIKESRKQLNDMLTAIGNASLIAEAKKMTNNQFDIWWNETNAANDVSLKYRILQAMASGSSDRFVQSMVEDKFDDIKESIRWAQTLPKTRGQ